jgi:carbonic anhydrase
MEMHLVHTNAAGQNAVVGLFLKRDDSSGALAPIFAALPPVGQLNVKTPLPAPFDVRAFLPEKLKNLSYIGSLTTPPCTEGVRWFVLRDVLTVANEDIAQFDERIHYNARPTQR